MVEFAQADRQLPLGEEIFLDHVGHFVRDPQAASRALARAGFAPTPVSVQTQPDPAGAPQLTGTGNVTAMLTRGYVEVVFKTADTPLGHELDAAMARHPGIHLVAFAVADAAGAHQRLRESGFRVRPLVDMQREVDGDEGTAAQAPSPRLRGEGRGEVSPHAQTRGEAPSPGASRRPLHSPSKTGVNALMASGERRGTRHRSATYDGPAPQESEFARGTAAFTVARLEPGEMPEGRIQLLTHRTEHMVWQPRWLSHPNGAVGLTSVVIAVSDLNEAGQRFERLTGRRARASSLAQSFDLDRGCVDLVTASTFALMCPQVPIPSLPFIGAYGISVRSREIAERTLRQGGLAMQRVGRSLVAVFPEELGCGAWIFSCPNEASADPR